MFEFKINNRNWSIEEKSQSEIKKMQNERRANEEENVKALDTRYYGITYCDIQKIYIYKDLPEDRKKATLIHELTHCYIDNFIVSNSYDIITEIISKYFKTKE